MLPPKELDELEDEFYLSNLLSAYPVCLIKEPYIATPFGSGFEELWLGLAGCYSG